MDGNIQNRVNHNPLSPSWFPVPVLLSRRGHALARAEQPLLNSREVNTAGLPLVLCFMRNDEVRSCWTEMLDKFGSW